MSAAAPLLQIRGLTKRYPGVLALDDVDLDMSASEVLGLLGKNGAGKSTVIKVLAGAVPADAGEIRLDGELVEIGSPGEAAALGIAVVHQELGDIPNLSVAENIELGIGYPKRLGVLVNQQALRAKTRRVLDRLGLDINPAAMVGSLSIAERRMVMIARGLAADARLLVLDEPTASLSDDEITHLHERLRKLASEGVAIMYVSHRLQEIFSVTDSVAIMRGGRTVYTGRTAEETQRTLIDQITGITRGDAVVKEAPVIPSDAPEVLRVEGMSDRGIVQDISFSLYRGEVLGIAGLVGAGRTELVRMVFGADRPAAGRVYMNGKEVKIRSPRDGIEAGMVLLPEDRRHQGNVQAFSIKENITLPSMSKYRRVHAVPAPSGRLEQHAAIDLVKRLQIKVASVDDLVATLSGGNQQKVVLAKWLDSGADVFIFDEPTHGIDVEGKEEVYRRIAALAAEGKAVLLISSEFTELIGVCGRVLIMREGSMVGELTGSEITESALIDACYQH